MPNLELVATEHYEDHNVHHTLLAGHPVTVERHADWLTTAYWSLPEEYSFEDFLGVVEIMLQEGEAHGWESNSPGKVDISVDSPKLKDSAAYQVFRPLGPEHLDELEIEPADVTLLRVNTDLAKFTYSRTDRQVGVLFYEKPHQTRSAFHFMAELLPAQPKLEPQEIGAFILGLAR